MRNGEILDSWKAISDYLDRDIRTCARWEKELGLPVYRINNHSPRSKVFAYKTEIDEWMKEKANHNGNRKTPFLEKKWAIIGLVTAVVLLLVISVSLYISNGKFSSNNPGNLSIAVLPFENLNFSEYEQYIPEGIQNEVINNLSILGIIKVLPSSLLSKEEESQKNLKNISERFNVDHALITKLEKNENKLKICVKLTRINDDKIIWDVKSEKLREDFHSLTKDICLKIQKKLSTSNNTIDALRSENSLTQDNEAFENYLKGKHILSRANPENNDPWKLYYQGKYYQDKWTQKSNNIAIGYFSKAIEIDENFANAYTGLARCYMNNINFSWDYDDKWLNTAEELLKKAETIDPECPEKYSAFILLYSLKYSCFDENTKTKAFELAQEAIKKFPNLPKLLIQLGYCHKLQYGQSGNPADFNKAIELNEEYHYRSPNHVNNIEYAELLMLNNEYDKALIVCNEMHEGESSLMSDFRKGEIYYYMGDLDKSEAIFYQFGNELDFQIGSLFQLGMIAAQRGDEDNVKRIIQIINNLAPKEIEHFEENLKLASMYMGIGDKEMGYHYLEAFFNEEKTDKALYIHHKYINIDKNFENFRKEERFQSIINKIGGLK